MKEKIRNVFILFFLLTGICFPASADEKRLPIPIVILKKQPIQYVFDAPRDKPVTLTGIIGPEEKVAWGGNYHYFGVTQFTEAGFLAHSIYLSKPIPQCKEFSRIATISGVLRDGYIGTYTLVPDTVILGKESTLPEITEDIRRVCQQAIEEMWARMIAVDTSILSPTMGFKVVDTKQSKLNMKIRDFQKGVFLLQGGTLQYIYFPQNHFAPGKVYAERIQYDLVYDERKNIVKSVWIYLTKDVCPPD